MTSRELHRGASSALPSCVLITVLAVETPSSPITLFVPIYWLRTASRRGQAVSLLNCAVFGICEQRLGAGSVCGRCTRQGCCITEQRHELRRLSLPPSINQKCGMFEFTLQNNTPTISCRREREPTRPAASGSLGKPPPVNTRLINGYSVLRDARPSSSLFRFQQAYSLVCSTLPYWYPSEV